MRDSSLLGEPHEEEVPALRETFEAQVLVMTKPYKRMAHAFLVPFTMPFLETTRIIDAGRYKVELVHSHIANGKPTLIIYEEEKHE